MEIPLRKAIWQNTPYEKGCRKKKLQSGPVSPSGRPRHAAPAEACHVIQYFCDKWEIIDRQSKLFERESVPCTRYLENSRVGNSIRLDRPHGYAVLYIITVTRIGVIYSRSGNCWPGDGCTQRHMCAYVKSCAGSNGWTFIRMNSSAHPDEFVPKISVTKGVNEASFFGHLLVISKSALRPLLRRFDAIVNFFSKFFFQHFVADCCSFTRRENICKPRRVYGCARKYKTR